MPGRNIRTKDIEPILIGLAVSLAQREICMRGMLGGSCALMLQTENLRETAGDLDLGFTAVIKEGPNAQLPRHDAGTDFEQLLRDLMKTDEGFFLDAGYAISAEVITARQKPPRSLVPAYRIENEAGFGLHVDVVPVRTIYRQKLETPLHRRLITGSLDDQDKTRLERLYAQERKKKPPTKPLSYRFTPVEAKIIRI